MPNSIKYSVHGAVLKILFLCLLGHSLFYQFPEKCDRKIKCLQSKSLWTINTPDLIISTKNDVVAIN